jgi:N-acetyl-anhydromuramyl-L-alanine amidase AmpD
MIYKDIYAGPAKNYGTSTISKRYIAIHNTSNTASAQNEAAYARRRTDNISSHYYADGIEIIQMLDTKLQAWHAGSSKGNQQAISYEVVGRNDWTRAQWLANVDWDKLTRQIARDCTTHNVDAQQLTIAQMNDGRSTGIVTHDQMRRAWGGTTHTDPGVNFPMDYLLALVRAQLDGGSAVAHDPLDNKDIEKIAQTDGYYDNKSWTPDFAGNKTITLNQVLSRAWTDSHDAAVRSQDVLTRVIALDQKVDQILELLQSPPPSGS